MGVEGFGIEGFGVEGFEVEEFGVEWFGVEGSLGIGGAWGEADAYASLISVLKLIFFSPN